LKKLRHLRLKRTLDVKTGAFWRRKGPEKRSVRVLVPDIVHKCAAPKMAVTLCQLKGIVTPRRYGMQLFADDLGIIPT
jgi:hypothetical protein